jgi:hypothetical protein
MTNPELPLPNPDVIEIGYNEYADKILALEADGREILGVEVERGFYRIRLRPQAPSLTHEQTVALHATKRMGL